MALLSIIPIQGGHCGIVVTVETDGAHRIVEALSVEVGKLVAIPDPVPGRDKRREITDDHLADLVEAIQELVARHGAVRVAIENPSVKSLVATRVTQAILAALSELNPETVFSVWRNSLGEPQRRRDNCRLASVAAFGEDSAALLEFDSIRFSAALAAYVLGGGDALKQVSFVPRVTAGPIVTSLDSSGGHHERLRSIRLPFRVTANSRQQRSAKIRS